VLDISLSPSQWILFSVVGILTGTINTLAGSGSLITLPLFMVVCGLSPRLSNGTNRIGAFLQSLYGAWAFWRQNPAAFHSSVWVMMPAIVGAIFGARAAVIASERAVAVAIGLLMLLMLIVLLVDPIRWLRDSIQDPKKMRQWPCLATFLAIGFYGGFIQAGVGIFLLAGLVLAANYNLKDANAIKLAVTAALSVPSLIIFAMENQIHYGFGFAMAFFQVVGAYLGVWLSRVVPNITVWIYRLLILMVALSAVEVFRRFLLVE
jgi:uncharacterized protein